jgi:hypothetical protein
MHHKRQYLKWFGFYTVLKLSISFVITLYNKYRLEIVFPFHLSPTGQLSTDTGILKGVIRYASCLTL